MNPSNYSETKRKAFKLRTKAITTSATLITYTTKVGSSSDNFIEDRVIKVTTSSGNNLTITVTDGIYEGQRILLIFQSEGNDETVTVTTTTGSDYSMTAENDYCYLEWANATTGWVALKEVTT